MYFRWLQNRPWDHPSSVSVFQMTSESPLRSSFLCLCISDDFRIALEIILPLFLYFRWLQNCPWDHPSSVSVFQMTSELPLRSCCLCFCISDDFRIALEIMLPLFLYFRWLQNCPWDHPSSVSVFQMTSKFPLRSCCLCFCISDDFRIALEIMLPLFLYFRWLQNCPWDHPSSVSVFQMTSKFPLRSCCLCFCISDDFRIALEIILPLFLYFRWLQNRPWNHPSSVYIFQMTSESPLRSSFLCLYISDDFRIALEIILPLFLYFRWLQNRPWDHPSSVSVFQMTSELSLRSSFLCFCISDDFRITLEIILPLFIYFRWLQNCPWDHAASVSVFQMTSESPLRSSFLCLCISDDFRIALEIILPLFMYFRWLQNCPWDHPSSVYVFQMTSESPLRSSFLCLCISDDFRIALEIILPLFMYFRWLQNCPWEHPSSVYVFQMTSESPLKSSFLCLCISDDFRITLEIILPLFMYFRWLQNHPWNHPSSVSVFQMTSELSLRSSFLCFCISDDFRIALEIILPLFMYFRWLQNRPWNHPSSVYVFQMTSELPLRSSFLCLCISDDFRIALENILPLFMYFRWLQNCPWDHPSSVYVFQMTSESPLKSSFLCLCISDDFRIALENILPLFMYFRWLQNCPWDHPSSVYVFQMTSELPLRTSFLCLCISDDFRIVLEIILPLFMYFRWLQNRPWNHPSSVYVFQMTSELSLRSSFLCLCISDDFRIALEIILPLFMYFRWLQNCPWDHPSSVYVFQMTSELPLRSCCLCFCISDDFRIALEIILPLFLYFRWLQNFPWDHAASVSVFQMTSESPLRSSFLCFCISDDFRIALENILPLFMYFRWLQNFPWDHPSSVYIFQMTSESPLRSSFLCFCISDDFRIALEIILPLFLYFRWLQNCPWDHPSSVSVFQMTSESPLRTSFLCLCISDDFRITLEIILPLFMYFRWLQNRPWNHPSSVYVFQMTSELPLRTSFLCLCISDDFRIALEIILPLFMYFRWLQNRPWNHPSSVSVFQMTSELPLRSSFLCLCISDDFRIALEIILPLFMYFRWLQNCPWEHPSSVYVFQMTSELPLRTSFLCLCISDDFRIALEIILPLFMYFRWLQNFPWDHPSSVSVFQMTSESPLRSSFLCLCISDDFRITLEIILPPFMYFRWLQKSSEIHKQGKDDLKGDSEVIWNT